MNSFRKGDTSAFYGMNDEHENSQPLFESTPPHDRTTVGQMKKRTTNLNSNVDELISVRREDDDPRDTLQKDLLQLSDLGFGMRNRRKSTFANNFRDLMKRDDQRHTTYAVDTQSFNKVQAKWKKRIDRERDILIDMINERYSFIPIL